MKECLKKNKLLLGITVFFSTLGSAALVFIAIFLKKIVDVTLGKDLTEFRRVLLLCILYLVFVGLIYLIFSLCSKLLLRNLTRMLRKKIFNGIMKRSYEDFTASDTADYISVLTNDIKLVEENYILPLMQTLNHIVTFVVTLAVLFALSPLITGMLLIGMLLMYLIPNKIGKVLQKRQKNLSNQLSGFTSKLKDIFSGYEVITSYHITEHINQEFAQENNKVSGARLSADKMFMLSESFSQVLAILTEVVAIFTAAYLVIIGKITMGTLIAIVQLGTSFVNPVIMIMQNVPKLKSVKPVLRRMDEFANYQDTSFTGAVEPTFEKNIQVQDLEFSYHDEQPVLQHTNLTLVKNKKYAVVGESGCGKSTLAKLLMGYYPEYNGEILYDGNELHELDIEKLKCMVAVIHQNVYMFNTDIVQNICLYQDFSEEELQRALEMSGVIKFLDQTTDGLRSSVGENGSNLSGGQRQRIAIARAIIQKTPLLILDEGTSAIDMQTAYDIESKLLEMKDLTLVTITHKMSAELLGMYDDILFMEDGSVTEQGTLEELLDKKGGFYRFFTLQS